MKNILVTGCRRSGTTFLGRVLSLDKHISYLSEPFNPDYGIKGLNEINISPYYKKENTKEEKIDLLEKYFNLKDVDFKFMFNGEDFKRLNFILNLFQNKTNEDFYKRLGRIIFKNRAKLTYFKAKVNPFRKNILVKDPHAALSSKYLTDKFNLKTVFIIRHPAAFYYSMKKQKWGYPIQNFLNQEDLINDYLIQYKNELTNLVGDNNLQNRIIVEWKIINKLLLEYSKENPDFIMIKHKDICLNPVSTAKKIYDELGINFNQSVENKIKRMTSSKNVKDSKKIVKLNRDSSQLPFLWKKNLSISEINKIKAETYEIASNIFSEESWDF